MSAFIAPKPRKPRAPFTIDRVVVTDVDGRGVYHTIAAYPAPGPGAPVIYNEWICTASEARHYAHGLAAMARYAMGPGADVGMIGF